MNHTPPKGWVIYGGADGFDAIPAADGYLWWGDNMWQDGKKDATFQFILCRQKNNISEIIPLPERCDGAGRLNWTPLGLIVSVTHQGVDKSFFITQYVQFSSTLSAIDTQARQNASVASQEALQATEIAKSSQSIATSAQTLSAYLAQTRPSSDTVEHTARDIIEKRITTFLGALDKNDRSDALSAYWMDVLFKKTNDWIYGALKDRGLVK